MKIYYKLVWIADSVFPLHLQACMHLDSEVAPIVLLEREGRSKMKYHNYAHHNNIIVSIIIIL